MGSPTLQVAAPGGSNTITSTNVAIATNLPQLQATSNTMSFAHLLPQITMTKFDGDLDEWKDWRVIFRTLIHGISL